jgi:hypothetical protein
MTDISSVPPLKLNRVLFPNDQAIIVGNEENLQKAVYRLIKIIKEYNLTISTKKTKEITFKGERPLR